MHHRNVPRGMRIYYPAHRKYSPMYGEYNHASQECSQGDENILSCIQKIFSSVWGILSCIKGMFPRGWEYTQKIFLSDL
jgi:hypothetical protein